jgi:hypothetical protein
MQPSPSPLLHIRDGTPPTSAPQNRGQPSFARRLSAAFPKGCWDSSDTLHAKEGRQPCPGPEAVCGGLQSDSCAPADRTNQRKTPQDLSAVRAPTYAAACIRPLRCRRTRIGDTRRCVGRGRLGAGPLSVRPADQRANPIETQRADGAWLLEAAQGYSCDPPLAQCSYPDPMSR